jgi:N-acetylglutamate synthase-like GNAT family acetyltransferase
MKNVRIDLHDARRSHARRLHALISASTGEGHLLSRTLADLTAHAQRFVVAVRSRQIVVEKIVTDCVNYPLFQACGQYAMLIAIDQTDDQPADAGLSLGPA